MDGCSPNPTPRCAARSPTICAPPDSTARRPARGVGRDGRRRDRPRPPVTGDPRTRASASTRSPCSAAFSCSGCRSPQSAVEHGAAAHAAPTDWCDSGSRLRDGGALMPRALIRPQSFADDRGAGQWWIASDLDEAALGGPLPEDHVLGVGGASLTLAGAAAADSRRARTRHRHGLRHPGAARAPRRRRGRRDRRLGACAAVHAAQRPAQRRRAASRPGAGSLFEPVAGEQFDRVVSNPPFVITPRVAGVPAYEYRDGGMQSATISSRRSSRGVGEHLAPGGVAQLLGNWETRDGATGLERVRGMGRRIAPSPLDAWVVEREIAGPAVVRRAVDPRRRHAAGHRPTSPRLVDAWLDDFAARGRVRDRLRLRAAASAGGRRADARTVRARCRRRSIRATALGAHLADALAAHDRLAALDDAGLAASVLVVAPDVTEARHHLPGDEAPSVIELRQGGGFGADAAGRPGPRGARRRVRRRPPRRCAGRRDRLSCSRSTPPSCAPTCCPRVRELLFTGFLRFAELTVGSGPAHARSIGSTHAQHGRGSGAPGRARRVAGRRDARRSVRRRGA